MIILPLKTHNKSIKHTKKKAHFTWMHRSEELCWALNLIKTLSEKNVLQKLCSPLTSTRKLFCHFHFSSVWTFAFRYDCRYFFATYLRPFPSCWGCRQSVSTIPASPTETMTPLKPVDQERRRDGTKNHQPSIDSMEIKRERNPPDCIMKLIHFINRRCWGRFLIICALLIRRVL